MGVRTTHAWRLGGFNPACHSGWLLYDNTKGLSIGGVCFFAIALQEHWNRLIARVFSNGADTSPQHKQTNKQTTYVTLQGQCEKLKAKLVKFSGKQQ